MLANYLTIAIRSLSQNRFFTILNIAGLSIGLATGMLMLLWVNDELSFDRYHPDVAQIYRENANLKLADRTLVLERCPAPHAAYALREIPEVEKAVRVVETGASLFQYHGLSQLEKRGAFVDTSFFQVFQVDVLAGNPVQPFTDIHSVVLNESIARIYFGDKIPLTSIVGQVLQIDSTPVVISAISRDYPSNTAFQYDFLLPYENLKAQFQPNDLWKSREENWGNCDDATYYKLRPGANITAVERKLTDLTHAHNKLDRGTYYTLQPLSQIHLYSADGNAGGAMTVRIFGLAALFILLIACINYINLATAKATKRAREVGLRKVIGALRSQLIAQFLIESALIFLISSVLALVFTYNLLPYCNEIADKTLALNWNAPRIPLLMAGILGGALLLSAVYPALILSGFSPLKVMKGQLGSGADTQARLRKGLVVLQFACSSTLLLAMFVVNRQLHFIQTKNLGYNRENVFQITLSTQTYQNKDAIIHELEKSPGILGVTAASGNILQNRILTGDADWDGKSPDYLMKISPMSVAPNYLRFFDMPLVSGSHFSGTQADATSFILNETAAGQMGIGDPVGKRLKLWETEGTVIGVVRDFHFASLRTAIKPAVFYVNPQRQDVICVKTTGKDAATAIAAAENIWNRFDPAYPFEYAFMDESFDAMYKKEQRSAALFKAFGSIAMLISCLGLFGLSAFTVEQRAKEISIRKILGASVRGITGLLAKDFLGLVLIAFLIASPIAYWLMHHWLADFAYRIELKIWMFAIAGLTALGIALFTVGFQSIHAALANPTKSLQGK